MIDVGWWIGLVGSLVLAIQMIPQLIKMWRARKKYYNEISIAWLVLGFIGSFLMLLYSIDISQLGLVILNLFGMCSYYLGMWIYGNNKREMRGRMKGVILYDTIANQIVNDITKDFVRIPLMSEDELSRYMMGIDPAKINEDDEK